MAEQQGHCERCARFAPLTFVKLMLEREYHPHQVCLAMQLCAFCIEHFLRDMRSIVETDYGYSEV